MPLNVLLRFQDADVSAMTVVHYDYEDALSALFHLRLDVLTTDPDLDLSKLIGHLIDVELTDEPYLKKVHGVVRGVRQVSAEPSGNSRYELSIVPPLWLATRSTDHRIFQATTADETCAVVVARYAGAIPKPAVLARAGRQKREYRVQYGESDLDFMFRALAEEGLVTYFDHRQGTSDWTIVEDTAYTDGGAPRVPFIPPTGTGGQVTGPQVSEIALTAAMEAKAVIVRDYDFEKRDYVLEKHAATPQRLFAGEEPLRRYEYLSGGFTAATERQGQALAQQLLEEARAERRVLECRANFALGAGMRFDVEQHPRSDINRQLLVIRARCSVTETASGSLEKHNELVCVPASDPWRPRRRPKPRIHGTQTALVVGAEGEEIDVDEHGRVVVEFRWDRRDQHGGAPTRRVRVSQAWGGPGRGLVAIPRVGDEVVVSYQDGDPDEPLVIGRLHNGTARAPLSLPAQKTISVWRGSSTPGGEGYNEILMDDAAGAERLELHAQQDHKLVAERDGSSQVGRNSAQSVGNDASVDIAGDQTVKVGGDQKITIGGARTTKVGGADTFTGTTISVTGTDMTVDAKSVTLDADGKLDVGAGDVHLHSEGTITIEAKIIELKSHGSSITIIEGQICIIADMIKLNPD